MRNLENEIIKIIDSASTLEITEKGNGWVNMADLGSKLKNAGIDFNAYGYDKLKDFIQSFDNIEQHVDTTRNIPVYYARVKNNTSVKRNVSTRRKTYKQIKLLDWAFMGYLPKTISKLKELALDELWGEYTDENGTTKYPILLNYLNTTFIKLWKETEDLVKKGGEGKILYSKDKEYAVFNTGLVDIRYMSIYALFKKNRDPKYKQEWYWVDFCFEGENRAGKTLTDVFGEGPSPAQYFNEVSDMLYDVNMKEPKMDYEHVLERIDRLPYDFIESIAPKDFELHRTDSMTREERTKYFADLQNAIKKDKVSYRTFVSQLDQAIKVAFKRVQWNFKSAIPMYYPKEDRNSLLLPLSLVKDGTVDVALVVSKTQSGKYQGETIYKLEWAYMYARLVCRPDSDWLSEANISNEAKVSISNEEEE